MSPSNPGVLELIHVSGDQIYTYPSSLRSPDTEHLGGKVIRPGVYHSPVTVSFMFTAFTNFHHVDPLFLFILLVVVDQSTVTFLKCGFSLIFHFYDVSFSFVVGKEGTREVTATASSHSLPSLPCIVNSLGEYTGQRKEM